MPRVRLTGVQGSRRLGTSTYRVSVTASITREQVLGFRMHAQQLDRDSGQLADTAILDIGMRDSGTDGALANRDVPITESTERQLATVSMVSATSGRAVSAATLADPGTVQTTIRVPSQSKLTGTTRG